MAATITVDPDGVHIPLDAFTKSGEGMTVITLAQGAYLIIRSDILASYPRHRLLALSDAAHVVAEIRQGDEAKFSERKQHALQDLRHAGYQVTGGLEYGLEATHLAGLGLEHVRDGLATVSGSLAADVIAERAES